MNKGIIVADASPLIAFGRIDQLIILKKTLGKIIVPEAVLNECLQDSSRPGAVEIQKAINKKIIAHYPNPQPNNHEDLFSLLDIGEANAIILASKLQTGLLIDEKLGRNTAKKLNIPIIGTAGVLVLAKKKKNIKKVKPIIEHLKKAGYYMSHELISEVLRIAKEN